MEGVTVGCDYLNPVGKLFFFFLASSTMSIDSLACWRDGLFVVFIALFYDV